jgi:subtilisin family serine protease
MAGSHSTTRAAAIAAAAFLAISFAHADEPRCAFLKEAPFGAKPEAATSSGGELVITFKNARVDLEGKGTGLVRSYCISGSKDCVYVFPATCGDEPSVLSKGLVENIYKCARPGVSSLPAVALGVAAITPAAMARLTSSSLKIVTAPAVDDQYFHAQTQLADMGALLAWAGVSGGSPLVTAVIDSGVDLLNPDLLGGQLEGGFHIPCLPNRCDGSATDRVHHGTNLAGIIAARTDPNGVVGVAWNTRVMPIKAAAGDLVPDHRAAEAIDCAIARGAKIINASFGGTTPMPLTARKLRSLGEDFLFITPTGNESVDIAQTPFYPASHLVDEKSGHSWKNVIIVMGHEDNGDKAGGYGKRIVNIAAPVAAYTTRICDPGPTECHREASTGTSNSTAYVSGAAALLWSQYPSWTANEIKQRLLANLQPESRLDPYMSAGGKLSLWRMMHPVRFIDAVPNSGRVKLAAISRIDTSTSFPEGMCTGVPSHLLMADKPITAPPTAPDQIRVGDRIRAVAVCLGRPFNREGMATSTVHTVIQ